LRDIGYVGSGDACHQRRALRIGDDLVL
jgi:hypothetical protein